MIGFGASYVHAAGDQLIFKGGVTCPVGDFTWTISNSGTSATPDYYGVDQTWYAGGSWTRPIFDGNRTGPSGDFIDINGSYVTLDNIEIKNQGVPAGKIYKAVNINGTNDVVSNMYIHAHYLIGNCGPNVDSANGLFGIYAGGRNSIVDHLTWDGSDGIPAGTMGGAVGAPAGSNAIIRYSTIHDMPNAICCGNPAAVYGNVIYNTHMSCDSNEHGNAFETITNSSRVEFYNNVLSNAGNSGVTLLVCGNIDIYNNVIYNSGGSPIQIDTNCGGDASAAATVYNNTLQASGGLIRVVQRGSSLGSLTAENNHFITDSSVPICTSVQDPSNCSPVGTLTASNNVLMSNAVATSQGYTATEANPYSPTSANNSTVAVALNLTNSCGNLLGLCSDRLGVARPASGAWDSGAYQFASTGGGGSPPPPPPDTTPPSVPAGLTVGTVTTSTVALFWTASTDNVGVTGYKIYRGGTQIGTSAGTSYTDTSLTASTTYSYTVSAYDAAGNNSVQSASTNATTQSPPPQQAPPPAPPSGCFLADASWRNISFATQSNDTFTIQFDATPQGTAIDGVTGISTNPAAAYTDMAAIVRFNANGNIDVMNSSSYQSLATYPYAASTTYHFVFAVDIPAKTYSVTVTPQGGTTTTLATNYQFRNTQATASSFSYLNTMDVGSHLVCNVSVAASAPPPDTIPPSASITAPVSGATVSGTVSVTATASDDVGVTKVEFYVDNVLQQTDTASPYIFSLDATSLTNATHTLLAKAYDAAGNVGTSGIATIVVNNAPQTLTASLVVSANSGITPMPISLTATAGGTAQGTLNYTFYCDRSDAGINITTPNDLKITGTTSTTYLASNVCTYQNPGTYTAKVVIERGAAPAAQAQQMITVSAPPASGGGGSSGGSSGGGSSGSGASGGGSSGGGGGGGSGGSVYIPPSIITNVLVSAITANSALVTVSLSQPASVQVKYGRTTVYDLATLPSSYLTNVYVNLTNLSPGTPYDFQVVATPQTGGLIATSPNYIFATLAGSAGTSSGPSVSSSLSNLGGSSSRGGLASISSPSITSPPFSRNLSFGDTGPDVLLLQATLQTMDYFPSSFTPTTYFGSLTQHALLLFQRDHQINRSGFLDLQSQVLMNKIAITKGQGNGTATMDASAETIGATSTSFAFIRYLMIGSKGPDVTALQDLLVKDGDYPEARITGYFGLLTQKAVQRFQAKYDIVSSGSPATTGYGALGPRTRGKMNRMQLN